MATRKKTAAKAETTTSAVEATSVEEAPVKTAAAKAAKTVKKPATRKAPAKKTVKTANTEVYVQFLGREVYVKDVVENVKKIWTEELGKKEEELEDLKVYIKPEDNGAYYVINGDTTGFIAL